MLTDIEIAQQTKLRPIKDVAADVGITEDELEFYGKYKAKLSEELFKKLESKPDGKLVLVTAINPTPAGEGKTTVTTGLGQAMNKLGKKTVIALREPSLGPVFGIKAVQQAVDIHRSFQWRTSTCTLQAICTQSQLLIIFSVLCSITTFSKVMNLVLMLREFSLSVASI